jgi:hypothetical protein
MTHVFESKRLNASMLKFGTAVAFATLLELVGTNAFARRPLLPVPPAINQPTIAERTGNVGPTLDASGRWIPLTNPFPGRTANANLSGRPNGPDTALLLTDASVLMHEVCTSNWYRLIPDQFGSYINGSWSAYAVGDALPISPMIGSGITPDGYGPLDYASAVLPDGRLIVNGGEYENSANGCFPHPVFSTKGSLYDPHTDTWSAVLPPIGWLHIGDSSSIVIGPNKIAGIFQLWSYMIADWVGKLQAVATISPIPSTNVTWTITGAGKADPNSEEGWTLLPNGKFLTVDTLNGTDTELFDPRTNF